VTPGFARPRSELPWLPYESLDRVIINAHNFAASGPTLLGSEVSIWCPSLDTAGNGTTTLTDLVSTRHISLVNMSGSDWVADTNNGGVRALQFNGTNKRGTCTFSVGLNDLTLSLWFFVASKTVFSRLMEVDYINSFWVGQNDANAVGGGALCQNSPYGSFSNFTANQWNHVLVTRNAGTNRCFVNGSNAGSSNHARPTTTTATGTLGIGAIPNGSNGTACKLDDIRIFSRVLSGAEITALASKRGY